MIKNQVQNQSIKKEVILALNYQSSPWLKSVATVCSLFNAWILIKITRMLRHKLKYKAFALVMNKWKQVHSKVIICNPV